MSRGIREELAELECMSATQLRERYRELYGEDSRSGNQRWLFRRCAWRLQAQAEGNISERMERIRQKANGIANDSDIRVMAPPDHAVVDNAPRKTIRVSISHDDRLPIPGTQLPRPFKGRMHVVTVLSDGFEYNGRIYKSLTAVAYAISGSHWNGFHFFREQLAPGKEVKHG